MRIYIFTMYLRDICSFNNVYHYDTLWKRENTRENAQKRSNPNRLPFWEILRSIMTVTNAADTVTFNKHKSFKIVPLINNGSFVQFGEYRLLKTLGQGEFGKVKLAVSQQEQKQVAIKFIKKSLLSNADFYSKIYREIELMQVYVL